MTQFIILDRCDILNLNKDKPVEICIDNRKYVLCSDEYYTTQIYNNKKPINGEENT